MCLSCKGRYMYELVWNPPMPWSLETFTFTIFLKISAQLGFCLSSKNDIKLNAGKCNLFNREKALSANITSQHPWVEVQPVVQVDPPSLAKVRGGGPKKSSDSVW